MKFTSIKNLETRWAVIGRVKIGYLGEERSTKAGGKYRLPARWDHFVVTGVERDKETTNFIPDAEIMAQLGEHCTELEVCLADDDPDVVFPHNLGYRIGRGLKSLICCGDGETAERRDHWLKRWGPERRLASDPEPGPMVPAVQAAALETKINAGDHGEFMATHCPPTLCRFATVKDRKKPRCKASGRLYVTLPRYRPQLGGVYLLTTNSAESIRSIAFTIQELRLRTGGILEGIPVKLKVYPKTDETEEGVFTSYKLALLFDPGKKLMDLAIAEAAQEIAKARSIAIMDLGVIRETRRKALAAADQEFLDTLEPGAEEQEEAATGFYGPSAPKPVGSGTTAESVGASGTPVTTNGKPEPKEPKAEPAKPAPTPAAPETVAVSTVAPGENEALPF